MQVLLHERSLPLCEVTRDCCSHLWKCRALQLAQSLVPSLRGAAVAQSVSFQQFFQWKHGLRRWNRVILMCVFFNVMNSQPGRAAQRRT